MTRHGADASTARNHRSNPGATSRTTGALDEIPWRPAHLEDRRESDEPEPDVHARNRAADVEPERERADPVRPDESEVIDDTGAQVEGGDWRSCGPAKPDDPEGHPDGSEDGHAFVVDQLVV